MVEANPRNTARRRMDKDMVLILMAVLLPLVPAVILYRFLPPGEMSVSGPFKGLEVKVTGASAAYLVVHKGDKNGEPLPPETVPLGDAPFGAKYTTSKDKSAHKLSINEPIKFGPPHIDTPYAPSPLAMPAK